MPGIAGDEVARRILAQPSDIPPLMIAVTAMSGELYRVLTKMAGFQIHLVKPVEPRELIRAIDTHGRWPTRA